MLFGLSIGLAVAFAVFVNGRTPATPGPGQPIAVAPAPVADTGAAETAAEPESRFDFYNMLPNFEVVIVEEEPDVKRDVAPQAIEEPGEYVLQAGSFSRFEDADRRRAELALQGIESSIQRVSIDEKTYHRVRIGPTRDLDKLNLLRQRLREARIDVLRIRLGD
jgi:cell division protein FtsN